jgi:hypothetical protein
VGAGWPDFRDESENGRWLFKVVHRLREASRTHVGPTGFNKIQAICLACRAVRCLPSFRNFNEIRPDRVLIFVIDQYQKRGLIVLEWIGHLIFCFSVLYDDFQQMARSVKTPEWRAHYTAD